MSAVKRIDNIRIVSNGHTRETIVTALNGEGLTDGAGRPLLIMGLSIKAYPGDLLKATLEVIPSLDVLCENVRVLELTATESRLLDASREALDFVNNLPIPVYPGPQRNREAVIRNLERAIEDVADPVEGDSHE